VRRGRKGESEPVSYKSLHAMVSEALHAIEAILAELESGDIKVGELENIVATNALRLHFNPIYTNLATLLLETIPSPDNIVSTSSKIRIILKNKIEKMINEAVKICKESVVSRISSLAIVGYDEVVNECITGAKKLNAVYVLESRPWGDGVNEVEFLRSKGIKALLTPDYAIQQVVEEAEIALIPVNAITYDRYALLKTGVKPLLLAFQDRGRDAYGITISVALLFSHSSVNLASNISKLKIHVREVNEELMINSYELVNINKIKYIIADTGLYEPDKLDVEREAYSAIQRLIAEIRGAGES